MNQEERKEYKEHFSPDGEKIQHDMDFPEEVPASNKLTKEEIRKEFREMFGRELGILTADSELIENWWLEKLDQALLQERKRVREEIEKIKKDREYKAMVEMGDLSFGRYTPTEIYILALDKVSRFLSEPKEDGN